MVREFEEFIFGSSQVDFEERLISAEDCVQELGVVSDFAFSSGKTENTRRLLESTESMVHILLNCTKILF